MKQNELKKALKPLIKQCIKEVIFEEGVLSTIISEVVKSTANQSFLMENSEKAKESPPRRSGVEEGKRLEEKRSQLQETRKKMLDAIGHDSLNGINIFEGTEPLSKGGNPGSSGVASPLENFAPGDPGVDISNLFRSKWKDMV